MFFQTNFQHFFSLFLIYPFIQQILVYLLIVVDIPIDVEAVNNNMHEFNIFVRLKTSCAQYNISLNLFTHQLI